jgi:phosphotransferase system enzyme I (PtsI)
VELTFKGIGVSPGIAIQPALVFDVNRFDIPEYAITDPEAELQRLDKGIEATEAELKRLYRKTAMELGKSHAEIFNAHLLLLEDVAIREEITTRVREERMNVESILSDLTQRYAKTMESVDDPMMRERAEDLTDVSDRLLHHLLDEVRPDLQDIKDPCIVVAYELAPSDTANMNLDKVKAIALDVGSPTSHTAILARALEIPSVMGLGHLSAHIEPGTSIIVDGAEGIVIVNPKDATLEDYRERLANLEERQAALSRLLTKGVSKTQDGVEIVTEANIAFPMEVGSVMRAAAQGIGLYRTEFLFLNRENLPDEEEQYRAYRGVSADMHPLPVTLRTIDVGGDKFISHLEMFKEANPQLGWRAIRFCLERPDIFKVQLRAMLRVSAHHPVQIMFPMISGLSELRRAKAILEDVQEEMRRDGVPFDPEVKVGIMVEVPSAVMLADRLAKECDFFSIGTNDLVQYSLAVDRVNQRIAHMYEPGHPAVIRMIRMTVEAAREADIPCGICGEMAGDPLYTELLVGLGVTKLSMSAIGLPLVRAELASTDFQTAQTFAREVLAYETVEEVNTRLQENFDQKGALERYLSQARAESDEGDS